jgi:predicted secreted hydrolase
MPAATRPPDPLPVVLPRDDRPHDRLTEWWYYTGHLRDEQGGRWGFEFVVFRAERGTFPVSWAAHLALTDETGATFAYDQRTAIGPAIDQSPADGAGDGAGLALAIPQLDPASGTVSAADPWVISGLDGRDRLAADSAEAGIGISLALDPLRPPVLHDLDGYVDFGPAGGSYYYSRTRMSAAGTIRSGTRELAVSGLAWFDHQWGNFIAVGGGGWDWFAVNLEDGTDLTLSLVRDASGDYPLIYGTLVEPDGMARNLDRSAFSVSATGSWESPRTTARYPSGWRVELPGEGIAIDLEPTVADQELDTRASTGVVYWEGSQRVMAVRDGRPMGGEAYVELTGYGPAGGG